MTPARKEAWARRERLMNRVNGCLILASIPVGALAGLLPSLWVVLVFYALVVVANMSAMLVLYVLEPGK